MTAPTGVVLLIASSDERTRSLDELACSIRRMTTAVTLADSFGAISEAWRPVVVATANGQDVRLVKTRGVFPWHRHADADEVFVCWRGLFRVEFRDLIVELRPGQLVVVPRGIEHRTGSDEESEVMIFEPSEVVNTGDAPTSEFTAPRTVVP